MTQRLPNLSFPFRTWLFPLAFTGLFTLTAGAQTGNVCETPIGFTELPFSDQGNTSAYGNDYTNADVPPEADDAVTTGTGSDYYITGDDVVYAFTSDFTGAINISTTNDDDWIGLWVFTGCPFASTVGYHTSISGATRSISGLPVQEGMTYYIVISTWSLPESTNYTLLVEMDWSADPCSETPTPGATTGPDNICPGLELTLGIENTTTNNGITYLWETSTDGTTWADAPGDNNSATYSTTQSTDTWYRCQVTCDVAGTGTSTPLQVITNDALSCYCIPTGGANNSDEILNFTLANLNNNSATGEGVNGYSDYTGTVAAAQLVIGGSYTASLTSGTGSGNHGAAIWIDYNDNGLFEADERVAFIGLSITAGTTVEFPAFTAANFPGLHRLRVQYRYSFSGDELDPCVASTYTETEDYLVELFVPAACSTTPDPGPTTGPDNICPGIPFTLEITNNTTDSGISYQWQVSADGTTWTDAPGNSTAASYTTSQDVDTWYRCQMTCDAAGIGTSTHLQVITNPGIECHCIPTGAANNGDEIINFTLADLNHTSSPSEGVNGYSDHTTTVPPAQLVIGTPYIASLTSGAGGGNHGAAIWIDYNNNGQFEADERVTWIASVIGSNYSSPFPAFTAANFPGVHRLRVQYVYNQTGEGLDPCTITTTFGETEDYLVELSGTEDCLGEVGGSALPGTPCISDAGYGGMWSGDCICVENVGIEELAALNGLALHPNPATTKLYITLPEGQRLQAKVYDMLGQLVLEKDLANELDIATLVPGTYNVVVLDNHGHIQGRARFVKQ